MKNSIYIVFLFVSAFAFSQQDSIVHLPTVELSDVRLSQKNEGFKIKINDSVLKNTTKSLTQLLRENTSLYFKEYGLGMTSSVSFRGTNASQTAVIWNGININSQTTGQTDFNNVAMGGFDSLIVKSGGGSSFYGSGAIGGSIHLQHQFTFKKQLQVSAQSALGSYNNYVNSGNVTLSNKKTYFNGYVRYQTAKNDYPFLKTNMINENGEIENFSIGYNTATKLGENHTLKSYFSYFTNVRNLSRTLTTPSKSRLDDTNMRLQFVWTYKIKNAMYNVRVANLEEEFTYYENKRKKYLGTGSEVSTYIIKADADYRLNNTLKIKTAIDANLIHGKGNNIGDNTRRSIAAIVSLTHKPIAKFEYRLTARKEATNIYKIPFVGSLDVNYQLLKKYKIGVEASKNFRIPTYNDLYWNGLGNPNLQPETSYQVSFNQFFNYKNTKIQFSSFYIDTKDMIKWVPNNSGIWEPQNIAEVKNWGVETSMQTQLNYKKHQVNLITTYSYTKAIDQSNNKQLMYVPLQKIVGTVIYQYKKIKLSYTNVFTDDVFTNISNKKSLLDYSVSSAILSYNLSLIQKSRLLLSAQVNNIFNKRYEIILSRPMPNRNFLITINYKYN